MKRYIVVLITLLAIGAFAQTTQIENQTASCDSVIRVSDVIKCILEKDISILDLNAQEKVASLKQGAANYWPNPKVGVKGGVGQSLGDILTEFELNVAFPIEVGGKKTSRVALANAERSQALVEKNLGTLEVLLEAYGRILKVKELHAQEVSLRAAQQFVEKLSKLYQSRVHLDPEQLASKYLYEVTKQQYSSQLLLVIRNRESELNELVLMTQNKVSKDALRDIIYKLSAPQWPTVGQKVVGNSLWLQKLKAETFVSEKKYDFEVSQSFPDVEVGPYFSQSYSGPFLSDYFGVSVNFPFPVFNINSGGRALAKAAMESAIYKKQLMEVKEELEIKFLIQDYNAMISELEKMGPLMEKIKKSNPTTQLFERGLIPAALVVESQRSLQDLISTSHELELKTMELLFKIRSIEGNIDTQSLSLWPE